jgi:acetyl-CoA carboxylase biotin carboxyl carrier protein
MDLNYVRKLVKLLSESDVDEIEIEEEGKKVRIAKHQRVIGSPAAPQTYGVPAPALPAAPPPPAELAAAAPAPAAAGHHEIKSPIVGTYYRAPAPDAAPFVQVGSVIEPGTVLCIVEAMKLMNEIESDVSGTIARILVENGQPVEYGQTLFLVEKA